MRVLLRSAWQAALLALACGTPAAADGGAVEASGLPAGRLLWIGAHPDDEIILAPLLGKLCVEEHRPCTLMVASRGENAVCRLAGGCHPDVGAVRAREMRRAARFFGADLVQGYLPDAWGTPADVRRAWEDAAGGEVALFERLDAAIETVRPAFIITFDSRHGSTCHPAHRALGGLVLDALARLPAPPPVFLLEDRVRIAPGAATIRFSSALPHDPGLLVWSANQPRDDGRGTLWSFVLGDALLQPSQMDRHFLAALKVVPRQARRVYLLPAVERVSDPTPVDGCP